GALPLTSLVSLAATDDAVFPMVIDATSLISVPLGGGSPTTLATNTDLSGLLVVGSDVYFSNSFSGQPENELLRVPIGGGTPQPLAALGDPGGGPMSTDGRNLFFADNLNQQYYLMSWPLSGGS